MPRIRTFAIVALTLSGLLTWNGHASAAFTVTLNNVPGGSVTFTDQGSGDLNASPNILQFNSTVTDQYNITGTITLVQTANSVRITAASLQFSNLTGILTPGADFNGVQIVITATGLTAPTGPGQVLSSSLKVASGASGTTYSLDSSIDNNPASAPTAIVNFPTPPLTVTTSTLANPVNPFTLTSTYNITLVPENSNFSLNGSFSDLRPSPTPSNTLLLAAGLPLVGLIGLIRRRKLQQAIKTPATVA